MQNNIRNQIANALKSIDEEYAEFVSDSLTEIVEYPAPFLQKYKIYTIEYFSPHKPITFIVGFAQEDPTFLLTGEEENFIRLAKADGAIVNSTNEAILYATAYLEVTRPMSEIFYVAKTVEDIEFRTDLSVEEERIKEAFQEKYLNLIAPQGIEQGENEYLITIYTIREQAFERNNINVHKDLSIKHDFEVIETNLPLPYGL